MINPCSVSCRAVISYSLSYDAWGASTYLALKHATALVNKHKLTDFQGISLCNRIIDQRKYHSHVTEDSTAHIWIAPEKFTEQEEQVIKAYYMRQLLGRKILHARSKDFRKRSKESDTTLWLLQEGMSHLSHEELYALSFDKGKRITGVHFLASGTHEACSFPQSRVASLLMEPEVA